MRIITALLFLLLFSFSACGDDDPDSVFMNTDAGEPEVGMMAEGSDPDPEVMDDTSAEGMEIEGDTVIVEDMEVMEEVEPETSEAMTAEISLPGDSILTGRVFMPDLASGFKCQGAETRGGETVCLLPYQYTLTPFYTKTDHHGSRFGCHVDGDTFERFILVAGGREYPMFIEKDNPFGPSSRQRDYYCANYVGTPIGNVGRTHVRLTKKWSDFDGQSVDIKVCNGSLCDTLILR